MKPDNAEESFKCGKCGYVFSCGSLDEKECPLCGYTCTIKTCPRMGASNEGY